MVLSDLTAYDILLSFTTKNILELDYINKIIRYANV